MSKKRLRIESKLCRDCQICALACSLAHGGVSSLEKARIKIIKDMATYSFQILVCRQCEDQVCVNSCPAGAIKVDENGVVYIVSDECIQCQACIDACPYHAIFLDEKNDRLIKCDLCKDRSEGPLCAALCPVEAIRLV